MRGAEVGKPDFHTLSDSKVKLFLELAQEMVFIYKHSDKKKSLLAEEVWKDLNIEYTSRLSDRRSLTKPVYDEEAGDSKVLKMPKMIRSPLISRLTKK